MEYFLNLFSPETYEAFCRSDRLISGFRPRHRQAAQRIKPGDRLVCYMTKLSRWVGVLQVESQAFIDDSPRFYPDNDPFTVRFRVRPVHWLSRDKAIPIHDDQIWSRLSFTKGQEKNTSTWTGKLRGSLVKLSNEDGTFLEELISQVSSNDQAWPIEDSQWSRLLSQRVRGVVKDILVTVPEDSTSSEEELLPPTGIRESISVQALLAEAGSRMGMQIWIPRNDRQAVVTEWKGDHAAPMDRLPLNYDDVTLRTIEQIDVLWLRGRSIKRAFEVEHTTSIYSGILRMADLLALQPNMDNSRTLSYDKKVQLSDRGPRSRREKTGRLNS